MGWKYCIMQAVIRNSDEWVLKDVSYCVWIAFEVAFVYFIFPETPGRRLEGLISCTCANAL